MPTATSTKRGMTEYVTRPTSVTEYREMSVISVNQYGRKLLRKFIRECHAQNPSYHLLTSTIISYNRFLRVKNIFYRITKLIMIMEMEWTGL